MNPLLMSEFANQTVFSRNRPLRLVHGGHVIVKVLSALLLFALAWGMTTAEAGELTWAGSDGDWNSKDHWLPRKRVPDLLAGKDTAVINSGTVTYVPGDDWINNSVVTIEGTGSLTQVETSVSWIRIGNGEGNTGKLIVKGGKFNAGSSEMVIVGADGGKGGLDLSAGGSFVAKMLIIQAGTLTVSDKDSALNVSSELQLRGNGVVASVAGGTLDVGLIAFNDVSKTDVSSIISFSGGRIHVDVTSGESLFDGVYTENNNDYIDFVGDARGVLFLKNGDATNAQKMLRDGRVRFKGKIRPQEFSVKEVAGGVEIFSSGWN